MYHVVVVHISVCIKVCIYVQVRYTRRVMVSLEYVNMKEYMIRESDENVVPLQ